VPQAENQEYILYSTSQKKYTKANTTLNSLNKHWN